MEGAEGASSDRDGAIGTHRLEAFSDGVMAMIITIMAFQLKTPVTADFDGLAARLPSLFVYVLSFTMIGIYWNNHHHLLRATRQISAAVMWTNLLLLFWLSLIPFATDWVGNSHSRALPAATYGAVALAGALAYFALVRSILRANSDDVGIQAAVGTGLKGLASPIIYAAGVGLAFANPYLAYACYVSVSLICPPTAEVSGFRLRSGRDHGGRLGHFRSRACSAPLRREGCSAGDGAKMPRRRPRSGRALRALVLPRSRPLGAAQASGRTPIPLRLAGLPV